MDCHSKNKKLRLLFIRIAAFLTLFLVLGDEVSGNEINTESIFFENFNKDQGLVHSYILCMYQDSRGILWVGSYGGVQAFNGYSFNQFNISGKKTNILTNHVVNVIFEDKENNIWFGTEFGLNKYSVRTGQVWQFLHDKNDSNSISHNDIRTIYQDSNGIFWIGTYGGGLNSFNEKTNKFIHHEAIIGNLSHLQSNIINTLLVDRNGLFWIGTENGGISVFDKDKGKVVQTFQKGTGSLSNATVNCIFQDDNDNYWIGTWDGGLNKYNPRSKRFTYFLHNASDPSSIIGNNIRSIVQTEKDFLWVSTFGEGLNKLDIRSEKFNKVIINSTKEGNTAQDLIWTLFRDNENDLWIGTFGKGLFKENTLKNTFPYYTIKQSDGLKLSITSIVQDQIGKLWIGTLRGMYIYNLKDNSSVKYILGQHTIESISKVYVDSKNRIWIGSEYALYIVMPDRKTIRCFKYDPQNPKSISEKGINAILEDSEGNIWIGYWGTGVDIIWNSELKKTKDESVVFSKYLRESNDTAFFMHSRIWNLFEDSKRNVWIGTSGDLAYFNLDEKKFKTFPIIVASSFYEDTYGYLWIGSMGYGLYKLDNNKKIVKKYRFENGLSSLDILAILPDKKGRLWLGTSTGLSVIDPHSENISNFDNNYGLQDFSINPNDNIILKSGEMIFGGNNGFNLFNAEQISQDYMQPPIVITDIKLNNKSIVFENVTDSSSLIKSSVANLDTLNLDYKNKVMSIEFAAINYSIPSSITYAYKLDGFDEDWVITDANHRSATYTNLAEGEYLFKVKISYNKGKWIESSRKLRIIIKPPFWRQIWFRLLIVLAVLGLIWVAFTIKLGRNKLIMLLTQNHLIAENLTKDQEILQLRNDQLHDTINIQNKKIAATSLKFQSAKESLIILHKNLGELKVSNQPIQPNKLSQVVQILDKTMIEFDDAGDLDLNISLMYDDFIKRFAEMYPKLTATDIRISTLIRMNKSNKEIAKLLSITLGSLDTGRYRIRKKIGLHIDMNLNDFILRF